MPFDYCFKVIELYLLYDILYCFVVKSIVDVNFISKGID
jgi:hypothetical protein